MKKYLMPTVLTLALSSSFALAGNAYYDPYQPVDMPSYEQLMQERSEHKKEMQSFMDKVREAKTPEERNKLMEEHMKHMEEEMKKMSAGMPEMPEMPPMPPMMGAYPGMDKMRPPAPAPFDKMIEEREAHMKTMQEYMDKMSKATSMEERKKLMAEQNEMMKQHMLKMREMGAPGLGKRFTRPMGPRQGMMPRGPHGMGMGPRQMGPQGPHQMGPQGPRQMGPRMMPPAFMQNRVNELEKKVEELEKKLAPAEQAPAVGEAAPAPAPDRKSVV